MKIITVIGARPQFIKASVVSQEIAKRKQLNEIIVHTGQHFDENMSSIFFEQMNIPAPKYQLNINGLTHGAMTGQMLQEIEKICITEKPDLLMVYGDTNSTLAGALAAKKIGIKVAHIESGLRSHNMSMPEEINRIITDRISDVLFCPTEDSIQNLKFEGLYNIRNQVFNSGDVMEDACLRFAEFSNQNSTILSKLDLQGKEFLLCTIHRQENTDNLVVLKELIHTLNELSKSYKVVFPIHPRTRKLIEQNKLKLSFTPIDPVGYFDILELLKQTSFVMTDSGGLQKEAFFMNKFCITLRTETEWVELVNNGYNFITGANFDKITKAIDFISKNKFEKKHNFYGGGTAASFIATKLAE
jgi:UDP-GlcNAc3NAcA epimerase